MGLDVGEIYEFNYGEGNINNKTVEIKALFDDRVATKVLKAANPNTNLYQIEHEYMFECATRDGICFIIEKEDYNV